VESEFNQLSLKNQTLEKDLSDLMIVKDTLEKRLVKLEVRSERVNFLESELKNYKQREQHFKDAADTLRKELENSKRKTKELDQENQ